MRLMHQHITMEPPPIRTFVPTLPAGIEPVLARALAKNPARRYPSVAAFAEDFALGSYTKPRSFAPQLSSPTVLHQHHQGTLVSTVSLPSTSNNEAAEVYHASDQPAQLQALAAFDTPTIADATYSRANDAASTPRPTILLPPVDTLSPPPQKHMSRRSALGWILGGIATVGAGVAGGAGFYFYTRYKTPSHALHILKGHSNSIHKYQLVPGWHAISVRFTR